MSVERVFYFRWGRGENAWYLDGACRALPGERHELEEAEGRAREAARQVRQGMHAEAPGCAGLAELVAAALGEV